MCVMEPLISTTNSSYEKIGTPDIFCLIAVHLPIPLRYSISNTTNRFLAAIGLSRKISFNLQVWNTYTPEQRLTIVSAYSQVTVRCEGCMIRTVEDNCIDRDPHTCMIDDFTARRCRIELKKCEIDCLPSYCEDLVLIRCNFAKYITFYKYWSVPCVKVSKLTLVEWIPSFIKFTGGDVVIDNEGAHTAIHLPTCKGICSCVIEGAYVVDDKKFYDQLCSSYCLQSPTSITITSTYTGSIDDYDMCVHSDHEYY